jgi:alkylation response protein AidB-like acyl-CoA dehydrogenase
MRAIGAAERALAALVSRGTSRTAFGKRLIDLGGNRERVADLRLAIDQARLLTLFAAWKLDTLGVFGAMREISAIKVVAPSVLERVVDEAIQIHGGLGVCSDVVLTGFYAMARALRLADGPDAVHRGLMARLELAMHESAGNG